MYRGCLKYNFMFSEMLCHKGSSYSHFNNMYRYLVHHSIPLVEYPTEGFINFFLHSNHDTASNGCQYHCTI